MIVVVSGTIGRSVTGGQAWANMHYLLGLRALGHDVYYLEDAGSWSWVYDWEHGEMTSEIAYPARYIRDCLQPIGFGERWIYRAGDRSDGMSVEQLAEICAEAGLFLIRAVPILEWRSEYDLPRRRTFVDVDPGFTQFRLVHEEPAFVETIGKCETVFTIGQRIGSEDCSVPSGGRDWLKTVSAVHLPAWPVADGRSAEYFTSIMRWRGVKDIRHEGSRYAQRDEEFPRFLSLPSATSQKFLLALTGAPEQRFVDHDWEVRPGWVESRTPDKYRSFIQTSRAEFGVAKQCYVATRGGWFSDRSACYLASGRPVLIQDTGLDDWLPVGKGVVTFRDVTEAVRGVDSINRDYEKHRGEARRLAERHFATEKVLPPLLDAATA